MEFDLTEEHRDFRGLAKDFADREVEPASEDIEKEGRMPDGMLAKMADVGLLGITAPEKYGGLGLGFLTYILAVEQIHYPCAPCSWLMIGNEFADALGKVGTDSQKDEFLPGVIEGRLLPGLDFIDAGAEASTADADVTAHGHEDGWLINGVRRFQVFGHAEGPAILFARTGARETTSFLVSKHKPGYGASEPIALLGLRGLEVVHASFENMMVSTADILGGMGKGPEVARMMATAGALRQAIQSVACAQRALDEAIRYSKERTRRGVPISSMQAIQWLLAEMSMRVEPARWSTYEAAWLKEQGQDAQLHSAMSRLYAARVAKEVANMAIQVHGCYGLTKDYTIERIYRQARMFEISGGSRDSQAAAVADALLTCGSQGQGSA